MSDDRQITRVVDLTTGEIYTTRIADVRPNGARPLSPDALHSADVTFSLVQIIRALDQRILALEQGEQRA